jgi:hypothetical protein
MIINPSVYALLNLQAHFSLEMLHGFRLIPCWTGLLFDKAKAILYNSYYQSSASCYDNAGIAQLVERDLAKVEVESSSLFSRSK